MSETRWTPGPWRYCTGSDDAGCVCGMVWSTTADVPVAVGLTHKDEDYTCGEGPTEEARRANAHLIAAAPDLYEALEAVAGPACDDYDPECWNCRSLRALARARGGED